MPSWVLCVISLQLSYRCPNSCHVSSNPYKFFGGKWCAWKRRTCRMVEEDGREGKGRTTVLCLDSWRPCWLIDRNVNKLSNQLQDTGEELGFECKTSTCWIARDIVQQTIPRTTRHAISLKHVHRVRLGLSSKPYYSTVLMCFHAPLNE